MTLCLRSCDSLIDVLRRLYDKCLTRCRTLCLTQAFKPRLVR